MNNMLASLISTLLVSFRSRLVLQAEILALRHQLNLLQNSSKKRTRLRASDRILWVWLSQLWSDWRSALLVVRPETVIRWHRQGFVLYWRWKSRRPERPDTERQIRELIRKMCASNPTWGAPRIHAELLLRDRDSIYGEPFRRQVTSMEISEVLAVPRCPWQSPYVERLIGSIRRECLDHLVVLGEESLCRILQSYLEYYHDSRCHLGLNKDSPETREVQPPNKGHVVEIPKVGGLHHRYERRAA